MDRRSFLSCSLGAAAAAPFFPGRLLADQPSPLSHAARLQRLADQPLRRLAFGSCNKPARDQGYWRWIAQEKPQLWLWLGDTIYADRANLEARRLWYNAQKNNAFYKAFTDEVPVIGTWDDHDYYDGSADGSYEDKDGSKDLMLEFLDVAGNDVVRSRPGIFQSHAFGPAGQRTQVILLDLRYFMDRQKNNRCLLGELQWHFLEDAIRTSEANLLIIGSSLNICSRVTFAGLEGWHAFAGERQRFYELLAEKDTPTVLLSGDRHMGEIYRIILGNGKPVYEIMSSGLTHAMGVKLPSKERQGEMVGQRNFGFLAIDWTATGPQVNLQLRSTERSQLFQSVASQFSPGEPA